MLAEASIYVTSASYVPAPTELDASSSSATLMAAEINRLGLETREVMPVPALHAAGVIRPHCPSRPLDQLSTLPAPLYRTTPLPPPVGRHALSSAIQSWDRVRVPVQLVRTADPMPATPAHSHRS